MREEIIKLKELGQMPDESDEKISDEIIQEYTDLLHSITDLPLSVEEALALVNVFPKSALFGLEWTLLHLFETIYTECTLEEYQELINQCPSQEWSKTLNIRLANALEKNNK